MFRRLSHMVVVSASSFGVAALSWAGAAYLPAVGPAPLRFHPLPTPSTNCSSVPAVILPEPMPVDEPSAYEIPSLNPSQEAITNSASSAPQATEPAQSGDPVASSSGGEGAPVISPQMLVKYFLPGTNTVNATARESIGFTPPSVPAGPSNIK